MPTRTATVTGKIKNTGSTSVILSLKFMFGTGSVDKTSINLVPGELSPSISMSVPSVVEYGLTTSGILVLSRTNPNPQTSIASAGPWYYTEPHIYGSTLEGWGQGVSGIGELGCSERTCPDIGFLFEVDEAGVDGWWEESQGAGMLWPFLFLGGVAGILIWRMTRR